MLPSAAASGAASYCEPGLQEQHRRRSTFILLYNPWRQHGRPASFQRMSKPNRPFDSCAGWQDACVPARGVQGRSHRASTQPVRPSASMIWRKPFWATAGSLAMTVAPVRPTCGANEFGASRTAISIDRSIICSGVRFSAMHRAFGMCPTTVTCCNGCAVAGTPSTMVALMTKKPNTVVLISSSSANRHPIRTGWRAAFPILAATEARHSPTVVLGVMPLPENTVAPAPVRTWPIGVLAGACARSTA